MVGIHGFWKFSEWLSARCPGEKKFRYRCLSYDAQAILNQQLGPGKSTYINNMAVFFF